MEILFLHSAMVESSRNIAAELGMSGRECLEEPITIVKDDHTITVHSKHASAVHACPAFRGYPTFVYKGRQLFAPFNWEAVKLWAAAIDREDQ